MYCQRKTSPEGRLRQLYVSAPPLKSIFWNKFPYDVRQCESPRVIDFSPIASSPAPPHPFPDLRVATLSFRNFRIRPWFAALCYITLLYITLRYITLHYTALHYITWLDITLSYITLLCITSHHITLHYITLHYIILDYNYTVLHYIIHYTTL